ncbi:hypothetical protein OIM90_10800 [Streptomyces sp. AD16]|nr:hypothetical protein OIM90_10800 [Streptomyces sp. AD16]
MPVSAARPFGPHNRLRTHLPATAGAGAGSSAAEAAGAALLAALAHAAVLHAVRGRGPCRSPRTPRATPSWSSCTRPPPRSTSAWSCST